MGLCSLKTSVYLLLTEPAGVSAWFWRRRSRAIWSVAPDTLQPASDSSPGPGWFRYHQHRLGQTGVGVEGQALRPLRRDYPSQLSDQVKWSFKSVGHQSRARASLFLSDSRTGNTGPAARGSVTVGTELGQPGTALASGDCAVGCDDASRDTCGRRPSVCNASKSTSGLEHCASPSHAVDPVRNGSLVTSAGARRAHATDPGDQEGLVDQGLGVLGRSG